MNWLRRVLAHVPNARMSQEERKRALRVAKVIREDDPVIREYRALDGALRIYIRPEAPVGSGRRTR